MKKAILVFVILIILLPRILMSHDFLELKGPYLGQKPPGLSPVLFAPGIISTDAPEMSAGFTPDGKELIFVRRQGGLRKIFLMKEINGRWTSPEVVPFSGKHEDGELTISPDGNKCAFNSLRPSKGNSIQIGSWDIWIVAKTKTGWSEPFNPGLPVNSGKMEFYPVISGTGDLYFASDRDGDSDIFFSKFINGSYGNPVRLSNSINSEFEEWDQTIAPDDSYMIFCSKGRPGNFGNSDLYLSFRNKDGSWEKAANLGKKINSMGSILCPAVSADGKYIFFRLNSDIYWLDAGIVDKFRKN